MAVDAKRDWRLLCEKDFVENASLSPLCSIRTGGPARWLMEVRDGARAALAWRTAGALQIPVLFMGSGSNLLISDRGFDGLVIRFAEGYSRMDLRGELIFAQCGVTLKALSYFAADNDLAGLAFAAGIPGSLGGGLIMNAGAYNGEMSQVVESVECVDLTGRQMTLTREEADFSYRGSRMMRDGLMILGATLRLFPGKKDALYATMAEFNTLRRDKQPLAWPSAGSFFKRPPGYFAGALIEQAGLKGLQVGGAQVSEKHAGFLINLGGATTADFLALKGEVQRRVQERFGVALEPEVRIIADGET